MKKSPLHQRQVKTIARWALVLFAMAWVNLVVQAPVHAAMKQQQSDQKHCHDCASPTLCDTVLNLEDQSDDALGFSPLDMHGFQVAFVTAVGVEPLLATRADQAFRKISLDFRQASPPPLQLKTTLLI